MKTKLSMGVLCLAATLTACGGGGSSSGGGLPPSGNGNGNGGTPQTYSAKLVFTGALAGLQSQIQPELRRVDDSSSPATPAPIMIISPRDSNGCAGALCYGTSAQGQVLAVVSPQPSIAPTTTFTAQVSHVDILPTPTPAATPNAEPSGVVAVVGVGSDGTTNTQSGGTATATIGGPVNLTPTTAVYEYVAIPVECVNDGRGAHGYQWTGSAWVPVTDLTTADIYVTGSQCQDSAYVANDPGTIHFPGGGTMVSTDTPFSSITAAQWTNTETSYVPYGQPLNADGSANMLLIAKTQSGAIFKMYPNMYTANNGRAEYEGAVEVSGASVDGF